MTVPQAAGALLTLGAVSLFTGASFAWIARTILRRDAPPPSKLARDLLALGWGALSALGILDGAVAVLAAADPVGARTAISVVLTLTAILLPLASWAFLGHVVYLVRGSYRSLGVSAALHGALAIAFLAIVVHVGQATLLVEEGLRVSFERAPSRALLAIAIGLAAIPLAALFGSYAIFFPRVADPQAKRRALFVAAALFIGLAGRWTTAAIVDGAAITTSLVAAHAAFGLAPPAILLFAYRR